ncbi:MAG: DoxX family protein [Patescibacteria group bacterium]
MTQFLTLYADWAYLLLRLAFALVFIVHGWPKLKGLKENAKNFEAMGFKPGNLWGTIVALTETLGGLAIFFGFYTQLAALLIAINMLVAMLWKMKNKHGFAGGYELDLVLFTIALVFATVGAGLYSLDYNWLIVY